MKLFRKTEKICQKLDNASLWWTGFLLLAAAFFPYVLLGEGSVFRIHDQLDESLMNYVLPARHLWDGSGRLPELLGGINASGMQPSAFLFVPLYAVLPTFYAFLAEYVIVFLSAFLGMYFLVKELTDSSILAVASGGCFAMLPFYVVYGLSQAGLPLLLYAAICLYRKKHEKIAFLLVAFFGLSSHLVYTGFVAVGFWLLAMLILAVRKKLRTFFAAGGGLLLLLYVISNHSLFGEFLLGRGDYVSHRVELVNGSMPFWGAVREIFTSSTYHAQSLHRYLILPILVFLLAGGCLFRKMDGDGKKRYKMALAGFFLLVFCALFYGICKSQPVVDFKNRQQGFLHYFQADRLYWIYPAGWYLEFALCFSLWWKKTGRGIWTALPVKILALCLVLFPTMREIEENSSFYENVNQWNNGSSVTGYISWKSYFSEELMQELDEAIGRDKTTYRVAHLGISPAPALLHGFYTADGYSNNYPLEYKHKFRKVIEKELEKTDEAAVYFDTWGNRCYLFNATTGTNWMVGKGGQVVFDSLELNLDALRDLDCEYLFSCGEITNAEELGISFLGYFETEDSYWGIWLYQL